jgi:O-antigen ligase
MPSPAASASEPAPGIASGHALILSALGLVGLACLAVITLTYPGATRMYAWPWSLAHAGALLAPVLALLVRAFDSAHPLVLPPPLWRVTALGTVATILLSALASPYRGPSLLWSAPLLAAIALFFVAHDALAARADRPARTATLLGLIFAAIILTSLAHWLPGVPGKSLDALAQSRNGAPLGHSNYTAGLALLALPWSIALALRARAAARILWSATAASAFVIFLSSGSRAGMIGLAALGFAALFLSPLTLLRKLALSAALLLAGFALILSHPRTRSLLTRPDPAAAPNISNIQRAAMLTAAVRMGADRPLLGWGPGTTPLVYPRYRAGLDGGAENVLQLHSTPAQLWADFGAPGLACALLFLLATLRSTRTHLRPTTLPCNLLGYTPPLSPSPATSAPCNPIGYTPSAPPWLSPGAVAAVSLAGYAVFALGDWQLDVPVFAFAVAICAALLSASSPPPTAVAAPSPRPPVLAARILGGLTLLSLALVALLGRPDPTPELNVRALTLARSGTPADTAQAVALLRASLALNPDQEIAHFNLGWLLVVADPAAAERHFIEAIHLVPDKGGVYFGLGLARLNQNRPAEAARAFALECLNDPAFLFSPWWRDPALAALRPRAANEFTHLCSLADHALKNLPNTRYSASLLPRLAALAPQLGEVPSGPEQASLRERRGYPVLMRNLDLPTPIDLYPVRELSPSPTLPLSPSSAALPPKSWLPSPLLLELLDAPLAPPISH